MNRDLIERLRQAILVTLPGLVPEIRENDAKPGTYCLHYGRVLTTDEALQVQVVMLEVLKEQGIAA